MKEEQKPIAVERSHVVVIIGQKAEISDIHLMQEESIIYRINGEIIRQTQWLPASKDWMDEVLSVILKHDVNRIKLFWENKELDFGYQAPDGVNYRVNAYISRNKLGLALRKINDTAKNLEDLIDPAISTSITENILTKKSGLFLVTGATGAGKSTTIVAMLEYLNRTRSSHIITIEDPVEYIFSAKKCLISQREVGNDTNSFSNALRGAMREDPNIIFIGEIRDQETADTAIHFAETGHLVFATLHTNSASSTVNRFLGFFEPQIQQMIADRLSDVLLGVISQHLVFSPKLNKRMGIYEFMVNNVAIRNHIKRRELPQIDSAIETGIQSGMVSMRMYAKKLIDEGFVTAESLLWLAAQK